MVLECVPADLATEITDALIVPTIGIGAGPDCDGQVLVYHDLLGLEDRMVPRFVRRYADLGEISSEAIRQFAADVRSGDYPSLDESYLDPAADRIRKIYG